MLDQKLINYLNDHHVHMDLIHHPKAHTALELAEKVHIHGDQVIKTVILNADGKDIMAVLPSTYRIDLGKFKEMLHVKKLKLCDEDASMKHFPNSEIGAMPPFGNLYDMPTYIDEHLLKTQDIFFNSSSLNDMVRMELDEYIECVHPVPGDFSKHI